LIGKNGSMLETIQYLINRTFENSKEYQRVYIDADDYRKRRESQFLNRYLAQINKVKKTEETLTLEPMTAGERRIIHRHVEKDRGLRTLTVGEGDRKRVIIFSSKKNADEVRKSSGFKQRPSRAPRGKGRPRRPYKPRTDSKPGVSKQPKSRCIALADPNPEPREMIMVKIHKINAGHYWSDGGALLGVLPYALWKDKAETDELRRKKMELNLLLIESEDRLILIDTGIGNRLSDKQKKIYRPSDFLLPYALHEKGLRIRTSLT